MSNNGWSNQTTRRLVVVEGTPYSGLFFYEPTIGAGNLVASWAAAGGVDPYGNQYLAGAVSYNHSDNTFTQMFDGMLSVGQIVAGVPDTGDAGTFSYVAGAQPFLQIASALASATYTDNALLLLQPGQPGQGTASTGRPLILMIDNMASSSCDLNISGGVYSTSLDGLTVETWHEPVLATGFTTSQFDQVPRYRREPAAMGIVRLDGVVYTSAATAAGAVMFTLPLGYRPTQRKRMITVTNAAGYTTDGSSVVIVEPNGSVQCNPSTSAAGQQIALDGITFPVD